MVVLFTSGVGNRIIWAELTCVSVLCSKMDTAKFPVEKFEQLNKHNKHRVVKLQAEYKHACLVQNVLRMKTRGPASPCLEKDCD